MKGNIHPQGTISAEQSAAEQLERHLDGLSPAKRKVHDILGILLLVSMVASVGLLGWAIYVSVRANAFGIEYVPFWWFIWAAVVLLILAVFGLSSGVVEASPPYVLKRSNERIVFGRAAGRQGWFQAIACLVGTGIFAALAVYVGTTGENLFDQFITGVVIFSVGLGLIAAAGNVLRVIIRSLRG